MESNVVVFLTVAALALFGGVTMLSLGRVLHMALAVALSFLSVAGVFFLLGAEFLGVMQIIVYTGAVTVLAVFGIMLTRHDAVDVQTARGAVQRALAGIVAAGGFLFLLYLLLRSPLEPDGAGGPPVVGIGAIGEALFSPEFILAFELVGVMLLAALIGAVAVAREEAPEADREEEGR
ncbi:MAG: NADH-quinone oxidoreductase subunit J [Hydrogenibacillus schlegelii]|nr:NADH-quinone oxidoreductase subunit J [Hydrogenibacillus schlegelii]